MGPMRQNGLCGRRAARLDTRHRGRPWESQGQAASAGARPPRGRHLPQPAWRSPGSDQHGMAPREAQGTQRGTNHSRSWELSGNMGPAHVLPAGPQTPAVMGAEHGRMHAGVDRSVRPAVASRAPAGLPLGAAFAGRHPCCGQAGVYGEKVGCAQHKTIVTISKCLFGGTADTHCGMTISSPPGHSVSLGLAVGPRRMGLSPRRCPQAQPCGSERQGLLHLRAAPGPPRGPATLPLPVVLSWTSAGLVPPTMVNDATGCAGRLGTSRLPWEENSRSHGTSTSSPVLRASIPLGGRRSGVSCSPGRA